MVGVVVDLTHSRRPRRGDRAADQRPDHKRGDGENRGEDPTRNGRGSPVREPAPQLEKHRHGGDQAKDPEEGRAPGTCHESGPNQRPDVVQHMRRESEDPAHNAA